jgi:hypothetical protein
MRAVRLNLAQLSTMLGAMTAEATAALAESLHMDRRRWPEGHPTWGQLKASESYWQSMSCATMTFPIETLVRTILRSYQWQMQQALVARGQDRVQFAVMEGQQPQ